MLAFGCRRRCELDRHAEMALDYLSKGVNAGSDDPTHYRSGSRGLRHPGRISIGVNTCQSTAVIHWVEGIRRGAMARLRSGGFVATDAAVVLIVHAALAVFRRPGSVGLSVVRYGRTNSSGVIAGGRCAITAREARNSQRQSARDQQRGEGVRFHDGSSKLVEHTNSPDSGSLLAP